MAAARRVVRGLVAGAAAAAMVVAGAGAALAGPGTIGVDGVSLRLELPVADDDRHLLHAGRASQLHVEVANSADAPRTVRVYTVAVTERGGTFELGARESAEWVPLAVDDVQLEPGERTTLSAPVQRHRVPEEAAYAAAVVESGSGTEVVARAASVFHVRGQAAVTDLDGPVTVAVLLMGAVILGHLLRVRGRVEGFLTRSR